MLFRSAATRPRMRSSSSSMMSPGTPMALTLRPRTRSPRAAKQSTHEYVSKLLGKETIDTNTYGRSRGRNGSYSTNYQLTGRELMTPDEVRMLDNQYALLFIRGERPVQDFKYDILHHPNVRETTDGGAPAFTHGEDTRSIAAMSFVFDKNVVKQAQEIKPELHDFELLSEEELQEKFDKKEKKEHEKHQS